MSILSRLWRALRPIPQPEPLPPLPDGKLRIHLFGGTFSTPQAAHDYCFAATGDAPEAITRDQPGAYIDTGFVEAVTQSIPSRLAEFLDPTTVDQVIRQLHGANTLVIISEDAFAGLPYTLISNDTLTYLGPQVVDG